MSSEKKHGTFIVSLDFELYWGVRDKLSLDEYRDNLLGVRIAIPSILDAFSKYGIHATWATVGFLFFDCKTDLLSVAPAEHERPQYTERKLSPYPHLDTVGESEEKDPFHYARSLLQQIYKYPHQEIGSHTFSHYYCLEPEQSLENFHADTVAAKSAARRLGIELKSFVFPRNQFHPDYLDRLAVEGFTSYRGTQRAWFYQPVNESETTVLMRACRFLDAYINLSGSNTYRISDLERGLTNLPASRFLRPYNRRLRILEPLRLRRIFFEMDHAAKQGEAYHLWWHPHNFGRDLHHNLQILNKVCAHFCELHRQYGMESMNMCEAASLFHPTKKLLASA